MSTAGTIYFSLNFPYVRFLVVIPSPFLLTCLGVEKNTSHLNLEAIYSWQILSRSEIMNKRLGGNQRQLGVKWRVVSTF